MILAAFPQLRETFGFIAEAEGAAARTGRGDSTHGCTEGRAAGGLSSVAQYGPMEPKIQMRQDGDHGRVLVVTAVR